MVKVLRTKTCYADKLDKDGKPISDGQGGIVKTNTVIAVIEYLSCGHVNNLKKDGTLNKEAQLVSRKTGLCPKGCP